jgi:hypothetical protein
VHFVDFCIIIVPKCTVQKINEKGQEFIKIKLLYETVIEKYFIRNLARQNLTGQPTLPFVPAVCNVRDPNR